MNSSESWCFFEFWQWNRLNFFIFPNFFIKKKISIFLFLLIISKWIFFNTSETLISKLLDVKVIYFFIIKVIPLVSVCFDIWGVVTCLWDTIVNNYSFKFVLIMLQIALNVIIDTLSCIRKNIEHLWELTISV